MVGFPWLVLSVAMTPLVGDAVEAPDEAVEGEAPQSEEEPGLPPVEGGAVEEYDEEAGAPDGAQTDEPGRSPQSATDEPEPVAAKATEDKPLSWGTLGPVVCGVAAFGCCVTGWVGGLAGLVPLVGAFLAVPFHLVGPVVGALAGWLTVQVLGGRRVALLPALLAFGVPIWLAVVANALVAGMLLSWVLVSAQVSLPYASSLSLFIRLVGLGTALLGAGAAVTGLVGFMLSLSTYSRPRRAGESMFNLDVFPFQLEEPLEAPAMLPAPGRAVEPPQTGLSTTSMTARS